MGQRGKQSALEASVVPITGISRPDAPDTLTQEQRAVWESVVDALPAEWFRPEAYEVLVQYCRHAVAARRVAKLIQRMEGLEEVDLAEYDRLLKMQEREGRALSSLATRLRITPQSTINHKAKKPASVKKPWEQ
jgi:uncharacterized protein (DUF1697 family)